jgi:hypothetical protein
MQKNRKSLPRFNTQKEVLILSDLSTRYGIARHVCRRLKAAYVLLPPRSGLPGTELLKIVL